jgi:hypothetical protein
MYDVRGTRYDLRISANSLVMDFKSSLVNHQSSLINPCLTASAGRVPDKSYIVPHQIHIQRMVQNVKRTCRILSGAGKSEIGIITFAEK